MSTIDHALRRLDSVIEEIVRLKQSEFPYEQPSEALDVLERKFKDQQNALTKLPKTASGVVTNNACSTSLYLLCRYVPILGFILRSTNVRNAFETYAPLLRLAQSILGTDTKLILSSEWEFSPYVYLSIADLPGFVLIGLPAPESSNPLLVPLAGHELGHSVWEAEGLRMTLEKTISERFLEELKTNRWQEYQTLFPSFKMEDMDAKLDARQTWVPACEWAKLQTEEIFCDLFGLRLFSESYLNAFMYLVAPGISGERSLHYPSLQRRVNHLLWASKSDGVSVPLGFETDFLDETEPGEQKTKLLVSVADSVSSSLVSELRDHAWKFADSKDVPTRDRERVTVVAEEFRSRVAPTSNRETLVDILNAGWQCRLDERLWEDIHQISVQDRHRILADLMLKSMEVAEIHIRLEKYSVRR